MSRNKQKLSQADFKNKVAEIRGPDYVKPNDYQAFVDGAPVQDTYFVIPNKHKTKTSN